ncbi:MAG: riboflavin synthase [Gracilibacteraceae bacterium]|jgi:riboflavin synthase|nr:riboflavin synthase [Gracilibacteraceae bacterium]
MSERPERTTRPPRPEGGDFIFTGIIEELGFLEKIDTGRESALLTVKAERTLAGTVTGDSIAVNGVCLTVTSLPGGGRFTADVMPETLSHTALRALTSGAPVNLERALTLASRLGGHIVSGHVDGVGALRRRTPAGVAEILTIEAPPALLRQMIPKGSIAVDGISLTLVTVAAAAFTVSVIPHTMRETTLGRARPGALLNLETDVLGKYVDHFLKTGRRSPFPPPESPASRQAPPEPPSSSPSPPGGLTLEFLRQNGF